MSYCASAFPPESNSCGATARLGEDARYFFDFFSAMRLNAPLLNFFGGKPEPMLEAGAPLNVDRSGEAARRVMLKAISFKSLRREEASLPSEEVAFVRSSLRTSFASESIVRAASAKSGGDAIETVIRSGSDFAPGTSGSQNIKSSRR